MRALILNCTLPTSPEQSSTEALLNVVAMAMRQDMIDVDVVRVADRDVQPRVTDDEGNVVALFRGTAFRKEDPLSAVLEARPLPSPASRGKGSPGT